MSHSRCLHDYIPSRSGQLLSVLCNAHVCRCWFLCNYNIGVDTSPREAAEENGGEIE